MNQAPNRHKKNQDRRPRGDKSYRPRNSRPSEESRKPKYIEKKYEVIFFDSFPAAKAAASEMAGRCGGCDQLNVVIRAEGNMDDPELLNIDPKIKVYAGEAWTLIHERRNEDGWYGQPQKELQHR